MASIVVAGDTSGTVTLAAPAVSGTTTLTLPTTTGNVVADTATQTLTNKTLTSPTITGAVVSSMASSVITSGTVVASTSGTSIDFTSIPSWVKRITVMFQGVSTNGSSITQIQLGTSGGIVTSSYLGSGFIAADASTPAIVNMSSGFLTSGFGAAGYVRHGSIIISNITGNSWVAHGITGQSDSTRINMCGGSISLSGTLDRVRITTVNGTDTFDAGSINILYE